MGCPPATRTLPSSKHGGRIRSHALATARGLTRGAQSVSVRGTLRRTSVSTRTLTCSLYGSSPGSAHRPESFDTLSADPQSVVNLSVTAASSSETPSGPAPESSRAGVNTRVTSGSSRYNISLISERMEFPEVRVMKMTVSATLVGIVTGILLVGLATPDATAAPRRQLANQGADLVIQTITIRSQGTEEFHSVRVSVRVRNQGGAPAGRSMTALIYSADVSAAPVVLRQATPGLAGGAFHDLQFEIEGIAGDFAGMLIAVADAPIGDDEYGQVREGTPNPALRVILPPIDGNNVYGAIFTTAGRSLPLRFENPQAK